MSLPEPLRPAVSPPPGAPVRRVPRPVLVLYAADVGLGLAYVLNVLAGRPFWKVNALVDLNGEANLPAWYSSMQLFTVAAILGAGAYGGVDTSRRDRVIVWTLAALFLLLSLDEIAGIHEWLGRWSDALLPGGTREGTPFARTGIWMFVIGLPALAVTLSLVGALRRHAEHAPGAFARLTGGTVLLFGSALVPEGLANFLAPGSAAQVAEYVIEEVGEMLGATTIAWAAYELFLARRAEAVAPTPRGAGRPAVAP